MSGSRSYSFGEHTLDLVRGALLKSGVDVKLRPKSFEVLRLLVERNGQLVSKDELLDSVWGRTVVTEGSIAQCLIEVRRAIGDESQKMIRTVPRRGYIFDVPVTVSDPPPPEHRAIGSDGVLREPRPAAADSGPQERGADDHSPAPTHARSRLRSLRQGLLAAALISLVPVVIWWGLESRGTDAVEPVERDGARPQAPHNSIAVLPFVNMSSDPESAYFCDGISEEILNRLADYSELHVIARMSSFALKDSGLDAQKLSGLLGVRYLLQGSVRKDEGRVRITARLVDDSGAQVWSEGYDRDMHGIFAIQQEIAEAVATNVVPKIVARSPNEPGASPNLDAYQHYLTGREIYDKRQPRYWDLAEEQFRKASALDPQYAEPVGELAVLWAWDASTPEKAERAQKAIERALSLKPDLARAYVAQAVLLEKRRPPDYEAIEAAYRKALTLDPKMVDASNWLATVLGIQGRYAERRAVWERAARIDPLASALMSNLALDYAESGDFGRSERGLRRLLELPQPSPLVHWSLVDFYFFTGRLVESNEAAKRLVLLENESSDQGSSYPLLLWTYARLGSWERAQHLVERMERKGHGADWPVLYRIELLRMRGRIDESEQVLQAKLEAKRSEAGALGQEYGIQQALTGDYGGAIRTLAPYLDVDGPLSGAMEEDANARHALAWAYLNTGATDRAHRILSELDRGYREREAQGWLHLSIDLAMFAQNAALAGEENLAIDRLGQAVKAGWRDYYSVTNDARWQSLSDDPRFQRLMATVKADIDAQRARLDQIEAADDFAARLDDVLQHRS